MMPAQKFLGDPDRELCLVCHWVGPQAPAVVICPGIAVSMSEPRYLLSILARRCHELGLNVFQFDYFGNGDSAGDYTDTSLESLLDSGKRVLAYAESLGCSRLGLVGYGVGNVVASLLAQHALVTAIALLSPHFLVFSDRGQETWNRLAQSARADQLEPVYPQVWHTGTPLGLLWRATVGETILPAQPCGPLEASFLWQLASLRPRTAFLHSNKPLLVMSEREDDALPRPASPVAFELVQHSPTDYKPSWQWCIECREKILSRSTDWFRTQLLPDGQETPVLDHLSPVVTVGGDYTPRKEARRHSLTTEVEGESVLGVLHVPPATADLKRTCIVYEPGIPGQRVDVHCCGPRLAQAFTQQGFYVFRYDGRGTGVSAGEFHTFSWSGKLRDLTAVMERLTALTTVDIQHFVVLGNSAGARIACLAANKSEQVRGCMLWGPILVEPDERVGEGVIKRHPSGSLVTEYCGLWLDVRYNLDERRYNFLEEFETCRKPILTLFASDEENVVNKEQIQRIVSKHPEKCMQEMPGPHGFAPEVIENVIDSSVDWLVTLVASPPTDQLR